MNSMTSRHTTLFPLFARLFAFALLGFFVLSCSKDGAPGPEALDDELANIPGLGNTPGSLQGLPYQLPDGVTVVGQISGGMCEGAETTIGSGLLVTVCVGLRNDSDQGRTVTFPAGLILVSATDEYQHGVVLVEETIVIPPGETVRFVFHTYCGNSARAAATSNAVYTFGPITSSKLVARLVDDLKDKKIDAIDYWDGDGFRDEYYTVQTGVQTLLWLITDGTDLDWASFDLAYRELLGGIPNN